jgi:hypothetical protein
MGWLKRLGPPGQATPTCVSASATPRPYACGRSTAWRPHAPQCSGLRPWTQRTPTVRTARASLRPSASTADTAAVSGFRGHPQGSVLRWARRQDGGQQLQACKHLLPSVCGRSGHPWTAAALVQPLRQRRRLDSRPQVSTDRSDASQVTVPSSVGPLPGRVTARTPDTGVGDYAANKAHGPGRMARIA